MQTRFTPRWDVVSARTGWLMIRSELNVRYGSFSFETADRVSVCGPVSNYAVQGMEGVIETDFLAFLVGAAGIADRHLEYAPSAAVRPLFRNLGRHLRLEAEPIALQVNSLDHVSPENLVA